MSKAKKTKIVLENIFKMLSYSFIGINFILVEAIMVISLYGAIAFALIFLGNDPTSISKSGFNDYIVGGVIIPFSCIPSIVFALIHRKETRLWFLYALTGISLGFYLMYIFVKATEGI